MMTPSRFCKTLFLSQSFRSHFHSDSDFSPELCPDQLLITYCSRIKTWHILNSVVSHSAELDPSSFLPFSFWHSYLLKLKHQRIIFDSISVTSVSIHQDLTSLLSKRTLPPCFCGCLRSGCHLLPGLLQLTPNWSPSFALLSKPPSSFDQWFFF